MNKNKFKSPETHKDEIDSIIDSIIDSMNADIDAGNAKARIAGVHLPEPEQPSGPEAADKYLRKTGTYERDEKNKRRVKVGKQAAKLMLGAGTAVGLLVAGHDTGIDDKIWDHLSNDRSAQTGPHEVTTFDGGSMDPEAHVNVDYKYEDQDPNTPGIQNEWRGNINSTENK